MISSAEKLKPSERKCIATGQVLSKSELVRFVLGPNSLIYPDPENKLPGRGIWVKADRSAISKAERGQLFSRAAKQSANCSGNLAELVENLIANRIVRYIYSPPYHQEQHNYLSFQNGLLKTIRIREYTLLQCFQINRLLQYMPTYHLV